MENELNMTPGHPFELQGVVGELNDFVRIDYRKLFYDNVAF